MKTLPVLHSIERVPGGLMVVPLVTAWWAGRVGSPRREEEFASERNDGISAAHVDSAPPKTPP